MVIVDPKGEGRKICKSTSELIKEAKEKGVSPCSLCCQVKDPEKCAGGGCYAWTVWFYGKWQNIKEAARRKGFRV